tara:strand:- start:3051 stop:3290 length:240 start_codon:yes stop_codon:yes gene_type:complete
VVTKTIRVWNKRKRDNLSDVHSIYSAMLSAIPGMPKAMYHCSQSIKALTTSSQKDLSKIVCGTRRLGPALAQVIRIFSN